MMFLAGLVLIGGSVVDTPKPIDNVHIIYCRDNGRNYQGTGFFIRDGIMVTALHVASAEKCFDAFTGDPLRMYARDGSHDFALMTGSHGDSVIDYTCRRPKKNETYTSYGYSSAYSDKGDFWNPLPLLYNIVATPYMVKYVPGLSNPYPMRQYRGPILPGMSGGPVVDDNGVVVAINNAGNNTTTYLYDLADTALCTGKWSQ